MNLRKTFAITFAVLVAIGLGGYLFRGPIALALIAKIADQRMSERPLNDLVDGLHIGLCGAGSPFPDNRRSAPCTIVIAGKRMFMVDAGSGAARGLNRMGFNPGDLDALFLSHFHSDHIDGMGELMLQRWGAAAHDKPLPVYGPTGVETIVSGLMQVYAQDKSYRVAHHGEAVVPSSGFGGEARSFQILGGQFGTQLLVDEPDLKIVAFSVEHSPVHPAVGYRITYKNRVAVISGDTSKSLAVQRESKDADLLVHEALDPTLVAVLESSATKTGRANLAKIFHDIPGYHTTPEQVAEIARDSNVKAVLLTHIVPVLPPIPGVEDVFLGNSRRIYNGTLKIGIDGDFVSLPSGTRQIDFSQRN